MNLINCTDCGRLLVSSFEKQCRSCMQLYLEDTLKIKHFLSANPKASMMDVYRQTGVPLKRIRELVGVK